MVEHPRDDVSDRVSWYFPQSYTQKALEKIAFSTKSRLTLQKWVILLYMSVRQYPVTDACEEAEVGEMRSHRHLPMAAGSLLVHGPQTILGGQQTIVHIDKSLFCHKPKVRKCVKLSKID